MTKKITIINIVTIAIIFTSILMSSTYNYKNIVKELESMGYSVEVEIVRQDSLFRLPHKSYFFKIDTHERIFVHEFSNSNAAKSEEDHILSESAVIEWIGTPHLYRKFNIIILYMGENEIIHKDLGKIIGKPRVDFAGFRHP